jgi:hypothetical protein
MHRADAFVDGDGSVFAAAIRKLMQMRVRVCFVSLVDTATSVGAATV